MGFTDIFISFLFYLFRVFGIKTNKIVVSNYLGKGYGDNAKYIVDKLLQSNNNYDIVWLTKDSTALFPSGVRAVKYRSFKAIYELVTAKIWIDNRRKPPYVRKRNSQKYIMTWHGYIAIKKVEKDAAHSLEKRYIKMAKRDSKMIDYFISGSKWESNLIPSTFWYNGEILKIGYPRSDVLIDNGFDSSRIRKELSISPEAKILLYAPTFRHNKDSKDLTVYGLKWNQVIEAFEKRFGGKWVGLIRLHPNVSDLSQQLTLPENIIDVTDYDDMQVLIKTCDCLITDYSSSIIDAGLAKKIGLIYAADYDDYLKDRSFYFDIKNDFPFQFSETNDELISNIIRFNEEEYYSSLEDFFKNHYGIFDNGNASIKTSLLIEQLTQERY